MARLPRLYLPGCAQHIVQRGDNREICWAVQVDTDNYLLTVYRYIELNPVRE